MLYKDYIKVEQDFIPVFSSSSDKTHPERWKSFYPHDSFKKILTMTVDTLEKSSTVNDRPIWISGSYGTGKTFASFVLKHILEDDAAEVEKYFSHNDLLPLWQRFAAVRNRGKILVVHQSSSAGINSQNKLFDTMIDAVKRTLRQNGYSYTGAQSMLEKVLATITDPESPFNFSNAFKKYRGRFLEYSSPEEVISNLTTLDTQERLNLLEDIVAVAEKESYNWSMSVHDVLDWLRDVREKNNLYAVFFIWDEFTEYFRNNLNNITGLQEIAQNAAELNFYFFLITHSDANQLITDSAQRKIIEARFKIVHITLAESTAFQLMAQALQIEPDLKSEWEKISVELWENVHRDAAVFITKHDDSVKPDDMKKLLPIHPYAAYLLKFIAQSISSNQRTMFQFLCADGDNNFKTFMNERGFKVNGDNYLTTDYLWDYFFQEDNPDLDKTFQESIGLYNNFAHSCQNDNQRRVLKTLLILLALQQKSLGGRASSLLRATKRNIFACFAGTPTESAVASALSHFKDCALISSLEETQDTHYIATNMHIDPDRMEKATQHVRNEKTFDAIIKDDSYNVTKDFLPTDYLQRRFDIRVISPTKFLQTNLSNMQLADNQIALFYLFAADEEEQGKVNRSIQKLYEKFPERCLVADFSSTPFTKQRHEKFIADKAREFYFRDIPNQAGQMKLAKKSASDIVAEWGRQLQVSTIHVWNSATESTQVSGEANFFRLLRELNRNFFGAGLEEISINDKLFAPSGLTENVAKCALRNEMIKGSSGWLNLLGEPFRELVALGEQYWQINPSHTISKMKIVVEQVIENGLATHNEVALSDIWDALKKPPVGLVKCPGSVFLLSILLRDYADKNFYIRDINNNTGSLTGELLCNLVTNLVKELPQANDKFLIRQTPEHKKFCRIIAGVFNIPIEKVNSIDDAAKNIKVRLTQSHYPLWSLNCFVEENFRDDARKEFCLQFLNRVGEFVNPQSGRNLTQIADELFELCEKNSKLVDTLKNIVHDENFKRGMTGYIARYKPELKKIIGRLKLSEAEYLSLLNEKLSADSSYLWIADEFNRQIDNIFDELRLIEAVNSVLSSPQKKFSDTRRALNDKLNKIRITRSHVEDFLPELKELMQTFAGLLDDSEKNFSPAADQINLSAQTFNYFFENQFEFFAKALAQIDNNIDSKTMNNLFSDSPSGLFFQTRDDFVLQMKSGLKKLRHDENATKIFATWQKITGTSSPAEWSDKHGLPILCLFQDCLDDAQAHFRALNKKNSSTNETDPEATLKFIRDKKLARLKNNALCNQTFVTYFCGENYSVVINADNLRAILRNCAGNDVYSWFSKKKICESQIRSFAEKNYRDNFLSTVREKVHNLTAEQAQQYLEELIVKDTLLGIRVLKNS